MPTFNIILVHLISLLSHLFISFRFGQLWPPLWPAELQNETRRCWFTCQNWNSGLLHQVVNMKNPGPLRSAPPPRPGTGSVSRNKETAETVWERPPAKTAPTRSTARSPATGRRTSVRPASTGPSPHAHPPDTGAVHRLDVMRPNGLFSPGDRLNLLNYQLRRPGGAVEKINIEVRRLFFMIDWLIV